MQVVVNNLLTSYEKAGKGQVIVLLHGWGDTQTTFTDLATALRSEYTVLTLDLPGFGQTTAPSGVWNLDKYAEFIRDFLHKLNIKPQVFVTHSNGGALAIRGLASGVLTADKLVLLASAGIRDRHNLRRSVLKIIAKLGKTATFWLPTRHKKTLQKKLYGAAGSDMLIVPHLQETFKATVRQDVQPDAQKLKLPTLLIYGQQDKATPPLYGQIYARLIPGSRLHMLPKAGHFVHHDQPAEVARLIKEFLA